MGLSTAPSQRSPGPDVVRAVAILGVVVMNYHGYLIHRGGRRDGSPGVVYDLFDPWVGPLATRFAAAFALTAGVGSVGFDEDGAFDAGHPERDPRDEPEAN